MFNGNRCGWHSPNLALLNRIAQQTEFITGKVNTHFINRWQEKLLSEPQLIPDKVIVMACLVILKHSMKIPVMIAMIFFLRG